MTLPGHGPHESGDFWHGNTWRLRGAASLDDYFSGIANGDRWREKITANISRDHEVVNVLSSSGWRVMRLWESDIRRDTSRCADIVQEAVTAFSARSVGRRPA